MSISRRLRQFAGTHAGTLMASTLMDAAERIEALEATQPKDACDEGVKAHEAYLEMTKPGPTKERYVLEPHVVYVGAGGRRSTPRTSWKIYDRSRRAQSLGGVQRPGPFCVAYFYDEADAYKVLASLNGEPTISVAEATNRIGQLHAQIEHLNLALAASVSTEATRQLNKSQNEAIGNLRYELSNAHDTIAAIRTELRSERETLNRARQEWGEQYTAISNAAKGRTIGVDLPEWVTHLEARVAYYGSTLTSSNPQYYKGYSAQAWYNQWELACSNVSKLGAELQDLRRENATNAHERKTNDADARKYLAAISDAKAILDKSVNGVL